MTRTKKILSLLMTLAMLTGLLAAFAATVSADDNWVNVSRIIEKGKVAAIDSDIDRGGIIVKSCTVRSGELPSGMNWHWASATSPWLDGTPTEAGWFSFSLTATLLNGREIVINFYLMVTNPSVKTRSETIYLDAMKNQTVYLLHREGIDDSVFTESFYRAEIVEGYLPRGMNWGYGEVESPRVYGTPECAEQEVVKFRIIQYDGNVVEDTVKFIVNPVKTVKSDEKLVFEPGKHYNCYLKDKNTDQTRSAWVTSGSVPDGMTWSFSEVDGPHVYGTPTKAGMYKATFHVVNFIGEVMDHTVTFVVSGKNPFTDVSGSEYYADSVGWAVNHDPVVTKGTSETTFSPKATCTRGHIVTFLWRALGEPEPASTTNPFVDVPSDQYYYKAVLWAVENGVTNGVDATHFGPGKGCTRGQVVTFMWRAFGQPEPTVATNVFTDVEAGQYYYKAVLWAVENGITNGMSDTIFAPNATCTRGQIVTFLCRGMVPEPTEFPVNSLGDEFLLYAEEVVRITGRGTAVYGEVTNGSIKTGDNLVIYCCDSDGKSVAIDAKAIALAKNSKTIDIAVKGDKIGILVGDVSLKDKIVRGDAIVKAGSRLKPYTGKFVGTVYSDPKVRSTPMTKDNKFQYYVATTDVTGSFIDMNYPISNAEVNIFPGEIREGVVIELIRPMLVYQGMQIAIRGGGMTYGTFTVTGKLR
ncbi:MAG: S-layer homology domain-containing protein [Clostridia bacterium]|nr:S-layer homology domain-containing protein [Clostridia bacterium]